MLSLSTAGLGLLTPVVHRVAYPVTGRVLRRVLVDGAGGRDHSRRKVVEALDRIEAELDGRDHLVGDSFTVADLTAAALLAPVILPPEFPYALPAGWPDGWPDALAGHRGDSLGPPHATGTTGRPRSLRRRWARQPPARRAPPRPPPERPPRLVRRRPAGIARGAARGAGPHPAPVDARDAGVRSAGAGPKLAEAAAEAGIESARRPAAARARTATATGPRRAGSGTCRLGEEATVVVEVRSAAAAPDPPPRPDDPRGDGRRRQRHRRRRPGSTGAWLADRLPAGHAGCCCRGKLEQRGFDVAEHELLGGATGEPRSAPAAASTRPGWSRSTRPPSSCARSGSASGPGRRSAGRGTRSSRCPRGCAPGARLAAAPDALGAVALPRPRATTPRAARAPPRLRGAVPLPGGCSAHAAGATPRPRRPGDRAAGAGRRWSAAGSTRCPSSRPADQLGAFDEIDARPRSGEPMQRLLMGEVGSRQDGGRRSTRCCGRSRAGHQAALMAPTETLAEQHFGDARPPARPPRPIAVRAADRRDAGGARAGGRSSRLATGELGLVVGTHALIEPDVEFARLARRVVDEQHRFGVEPARRARRQGRPAGSRPTSST